MIFFETDIKKSDGVITIDENVIGFSIEPEPGSDDGFRFGVYKDSPDVKVNASDAGRDFGFIPGGPYGYEFCKVGSISIKFDGVGSNPGVLVIKTKYVQDNC